MMKRRDRMLIHKEIIMVAPAAKREGHEPLTWNVGKVVAAVDAARPTDIQAFILAQVRLNKDVFV